MTEAPSYYFNHAMTHITDDEYAAMFDRLAGMLNGAAEMSPRKPLTSARDALTHTWDVEIDARAWCHAAGGFMGVDTGVCFGG